MRKKKDYLRPTLKTNKPIILIDLDGVLANFDKRKNELISQGICREYNVHRHPNIFNEIDPIPGAIDAWNWIQKYFDAYICSSPAWSNPDSYKQKREWVETHLGESAKKRLILTHNKGIIKRDILIDDRIANGVADFEGTFIQFGTKKFPDWNCVYSYLCDWVYEFNKKKLYDKMV